MKIWELKSCLWDHTHCWSTQCSLSKEIWSGVSDHLKCSLLYLRAAEDNFVDRSEDAEMSVLLTSLLQQLPCWAAAVCCTERDARWAEVSCVKYLRHWAHERHWTENAHTESERKDC